MSDQFIDLVGFTILVLVFLLGMVTLAILVGHATTPALGIATSCALTIATAYLLNDHLKEEQQ